MKVRSILVLVAMTTSLLLQVTPSHANIDEGCTIAGGSADTPHLIDPFGDATLADTDPSAEAYDDTDVLAAYFARDVGGTVTANIQVQTLTGAESNVVYYLRWDYRGNDPVLKTTRWVSIQPRPSAPAGSPVAYGPRFRWGYLDTTTVGVQTLVAEGDSTGSVALGTPGIMSVVVPLDKMGNPQPGELLTNLVVQARVLIGGPGLPPGYGLPALPPPAPSVPGGLVSTVDDSTNALDYCADVEV